MTRAELKSQLCDYCGIFSQDYNLYGIMSEIFTEYPNISSIDDIDYDDFVEILQKYDKASWQDPVTGEKIDETEYYRRMAAMED